jgi:TolA-binding protein
VASELDGLRRRVDEANALLKRHQLAVTQLTDSVAALVALGRKRERWINLNSFVAYFLFTVLLGGALFLLYRSRVGEVEARHAAARVVAPPPTTTPTPPPTVTTPVAPAKTPDGDAAWGLYQLVRAGDDAALIARHADLDAASLSQTERAVLADAVAAARQRVASRDVKQGLDDYRTGKWADAAGSFERAIAVDGDSARTAQYRYHLGKARWKLADYRAAADQLGKAVAGELDDDSIDARYYFAASLDRVGDLAGARAEYDRFATAFPKAGLALIARRRSAVLARGPRPAKPAAGVVAPKKKAATPPAADDDATIAPEPPPTETGGDPAAP